jgi:hypothetical protein
MSNFLIRWLERRAHVCRLAQEDAHHLLDAMPCRSDAEVLVWAAAARLQACSMLYRRMWRRTAAAILAHMGA